MKIADILTPEHAYCNVDGVSKKRVLENLSIFLNDDQDVSGTESDAIYQKLLERERLGSTGIGSGVAVPHCRVPGCTRITGVLLKLSDQVDFDAIDGEPVDLVFALMVPDEHNDAHLQALALIAELLQDESSRRRLRGATSNQSLYDLATSQGI
ncbi:MAG: PTS fructose transporter subunit IIA [Porticoccaceae bacterium]|nr:PTS fructose transporter subunit IIA [Porticoccaceae bacterium]